MKLSVSLRGLTICCLLLITATLAVILTPHFLPTGSAPDLESTLPESIDEWRIIKTPTIPVSVSTESGINQPYDQTVMRSYVDNNGFVLHLAVAWGETQRQEVKIHRPELCYPAQGLQVIKMNDVTFPVHHNTPITGKRMIVRDRYGQLQAVSYWIRIGSLYSDSAWQTRKHILAEGLAGRIPDGVLVRVSQPVRQESELEAAFTRQEMFASRLVAHTDKRVRAMLIR